MKKIGLGISFFICFMLMIIGATPMSASETNSDFRISDTTVYEYTGTDSVVVIPDGVKQIWDEVFNDCANLKSITIPKSVEKFYANNFYQCDSLENVYLDSVAVFSSLRVSFILQVRTISSPNSNAFLV